MDEFNGDLDTLIQGKIEADEDFQASLTDLSEDEQQQALAVKTAELVKAEYASLAEKAKKNAEIAKNQEIRAKKAEELAKRTKPETETPKNESYSISDIKALQDVDENDVDEVVAFAKFKGISIAEAKKHPVMVSTLKTNAEMRTSAQVANTTPKRGVHKTTDEQILNDFEQGKIPEDDEGIRRLAQAQLESRKKKN